MVKLNDVNPTGSQLLVNLGALGQVAGAAAAGTPSLSALIVSRAVAAIDTVSGFALNDGANTGSSMELTGSARVRVATDLFAILALGIVKAQFGTTITVYKSATGTIALSGADLPGILANRISSAPATAPLQELKEWTALLAYLGTGLRGVVTPAYASTSDFTRFGDLGAAVQTRNASYPIASISQLIGTLTGLQGALSCTASSPPVIAAVTNGSYGDRLSASGTIVVWGTGFNASGGNALVFTRFASAELITLNVASGSYFWDLSPNQINVAVAGRISPGQWALSVKNACGATSADFAVTIQ